MLLAELSENLIAYMHFLQKPAGFDDGDDPVEAATRRTNMAAVSSGNLCADVRVLLFSPTHLWNVYTWQRTEATQTDRTFCPGTIMSNWWFFVHVQTFQRECLTLPNPKSQRSESSQQQQKFKAPMWPSDVQNTSKGTLMVSDGCTAA